MSTGDGRVWLIVCQAVIIVVGNRHSADACECGESKLEDRICSSDFMGIVRVMGDITNPEIPMKLYEIHVNEVWRNVNGSIPSQAQTPVDSAECGVFLELKADYILSGNINNKTQLLLNLCTCEVRNFLHVDEISRSKLNETAHSCKKA